MTRHAITGITALTIALSAGTAAAQYGTTEPDRDQTQRQQQREQDRMQQLQLHKASELTGKELKNPNGETVGNIDDFIVERGTGSIAFAVVRTGAVLGMGGTRFVVPFNELTWSQAEETFQTNMTEEQAERQAEFLPENWDNLEETGWMDRIQGWMGFDRETDREHERKTAEACKNAEKQEISGTVLDVKRDSDWDTSEKIVVDIQTQEGEREEVVLGPSWYVMSHESAPMRGDTITVKAFRHDDKMVAVSSRHRGGQELRLRDDQGNAAWAKDDQRTDRDAQQRDRDRRQGDRDRQSDRDRQQGERDRQSDRDRQQTDRDRQQTDRDRYAQRTDRATRYVLLSDLIGANAEARGISSGEIEDAIVESRSGKVVFLAFDPNENFLGIGDRVSAVPFTIAHIGADMTVNIDADENSLGNAIEFPDNVERLQTRNVFDSAYRPFNTEPAKLRPINARTDGARDGARDRSRTNAPTDRP